MTSLQHEVPFLGFSGLLSVSKALVLRRGNGLIHELPGQGLTSNSLIPSEPSPGAPEQTSPGSLETEAQNTVS